MDGTLDALAQVLSELSERPYDIALHSRHIRIAQSLEDNQTEVQSALEMFVQFLAAGEDAWLELIKAKEASVDLGTVEGVQELLALYSRAEADYLSIPILQKHLQFIIDRHAHYVGEEAKPAELGALFSTSWTRAAIADVVNKGVRHITQSHLLWDVQRDWELEALEAAVPSERKLLVESLQSFHLIRLRQPHSNPEDTSQSYSSFTTKYQPPQDYETLLIAASKVRTQGTKSFDRREPMETGLVQSGFALEAYALYIAYERRARNPDLFVMSGVYERAIAEAAKRRFEGGAGAEETLRMFWMGYCDTLRVNEAGEDLEYSILTRAVRSVPGSGEVWARYIRYLERMEDSPVAPEGRGTISDLFTLAFGTNLLQIDVEQIVPVILARAGYERRRFEAGTDDEDILPTLIAILEGGIEMVRKASKAGDAKFRLEKYLADIYLQLVEVPDGPVTVWQTATKHYKTRYLAWTSYTDALIKNGEFDETRKVFSDVHAKNLDWPEAIWEAWISFEHLHGTVDQVDACLDKIEKAQYQVNIRRAKEVEKASYQAMQMQAANVPVAQVPVPIISGDATMTVATAPRERGTKRGADDTQDGDGHKRARIEQKPPPLKRDRENCTVFVADLPPGVTEEELGNLFKDCGKVREVKISELTNALVATVEFFERDSIPAALTKDKKRVQEQEVAVHPAWKSTLYVTNFPESVDDASMRSLFDKYGTIFDIRWPSKKFKSTRRFCYVQFTSPTSAENALELHGHELEPNQPMNVFISKPEWKKERTDQDANEREVYVAGLSKFTTQADLEKLFKTYGKVKEVRMATDKDGSAKGFAFVEFEAEKDALTALEANNYELKKRRIAVTLADSRVRARNRNFTSDTGLGRVAEVRSRSVRVRNLPAGTQEALLQQALDKIALVKRVEVFVEQREAVVELENVAEAGKLLLQTEPFIFDGNTLQLTEEGRDGAPTRAGAPPPKTGGMFVPRKAVSRPRAGLSHGRKPAPETNASGSQPPSVPSPYTSGSQAFGKGQDDFRKMLGGR